MKNKVGLIAIVFLFSLTLISSAVVIGETDEDSVDAVVIKNPIQKVLAPIGFSTYDAEPARTSVSNLNGDLLSLSSGGAIDANTNITLVQGLGKMLIVINAGTDVSGTLSINGTKVDRVTGVRTQNFVDEVVINGISVDSSTNDANSNLVYNIAGAYLTNFWFTNGVRIYSSNLTLTDVDVYHISFEQINDNPGIIINTFDANLLSTSTNAQFDAYLYSVIKNSSGRVTIKNESGLHVGTITNPAVANRYYRLRNGALNVKLDGTTDGFWANIHYTNSPAFIEDMTLKIWATEETFLE